MIQQLRDYWHASPFVPFDLHLSDGRTLHVPHPDFFSMSPNGGMILVYDDQDHSHLVNPIMLVSVSLKVAPPPQEAATAERK